MNSFKRTFDFVAGFPILPVPHLRADCCHSLFGTSQSRNSCISTEETLSVPALHSKWFNVEREMLTVGNPLIDS